MRISDWSSDVCSSDLLIDKPRFREQPLLLVCELAKKAFATQQPTLVLTRDHDQAHALDELLWAFDDDAMIPHQLAGDDDDDERSAERRGGKECVSKCRSRGGPVPTKKTNDKDT